MYDDVAVLDDQVTTYHEQLDTFSNLPFSIP